MTPPDELTRARVRSAAMTTGLGLGMADSWLVGADLTVAEGIWLLLTAGALYAAVGFVIGVGIRVRTAAGAAAILVGLALAISQLKVCHGHWLAGTPTSQALLEGVLRLGAVLLVAAGLRRLLMRLPAVPLPPWELLVGLIVAGGVLTWFEIDRVSDPGRTVRVTRQATDAVGSGRSIVLIVVDTLRADRVGAWGQPEPLTPHLDRAARSGWTFADARSHASWTRPETASLLTSLPPSRHGARTLADPLAASALTLSEVLSVRGYRTLAFSANETVGPQFGFAQGFSEFSLLASLSPALQAWHDLGLVRFSALSLGLPVYVGDAFSPTAPLLLAALEDRLEREQRALPTFLYVHLMDPHSPYLDRAWGPFHRRTFNLPRLQDEVLAAYGREVQVADGAVGRILALTRRVPGLRDALVVATSDHGEEFREHGGISHGHTLYEEQLAVPLLLAGDGRGLHRGIVRGIDVAPLVLSSARMRIPEDFAGRDPRRSPPPEAMFFEQRLGATHLRGVRHRDWKLVRDEGAVPPRIEMYDLGPDPGERRVIDDHEARAELMRRLDENVPASEPPSGPLSPSQERALRALGYLP